MRRFVSGQVPQDRPMAAAAGMLYRSAVVRDLHVHVLANDRHSPLAEHCA